MTNVGRPPATVWCFQRRFRHKIVNTTEHITISTQGLTTSPGWHVAYIVLSLGPQVGRPCLATKLQLLGAKAEMGSANAKLTTHRARSVTQSWRNQSVPMLPPLRVTAEQPSITAGQEYKSARVYFSAVGQSLVPTPPSNKARTNDRIS